jgi:hypothetical protein
MTWPFLSVDHGFPLFHSLLHPGSVISGCKFLVESLFPFACRERDHRVNEGFHVAKILTPQNWKMKLYIHLWECGKGPWTLKGQLCWVCFIWWPQEGQETHITISLNVYISQLWCLHLIIVQNEWIQLMNCLGHGLTCESFKRWLRLRLKRMWTMLNGRRQIRGLQ